MKRIGGLFEKIHSRESLITAAYKASSGKQRTRELSEFFRHFEVSINELSDSLRRGIFRFGDYQSFELWDRKKRTIHAPSFRDRVVHHAMIIAVGSTLEISAGQTSFACRQGMGMHKALQTARRYTRRSRFYGKIDIKKYYDSISHQQLMRRLSRRFRESRLLRLFEDLLASYQVCQGHGIPIGALTSQYLGNFYLDAFDEQIRSEFKIRYYVRYMDDVVIWGDRPVLDAIRHRSRELLSEMGLVMKHDGEWNSCQQGVPFLGYVVYPDRLRLGVSARKRLRRKYRSLSSKNYSEDELSNRATALFAHAQVSDDVEWRRQWLDFSEFGEASELSQPCDTGRFVQQPCDQLPLSLSQQEEARQPQQESGLAARFAPRHGGARHGCARPPDVTPSCASVPRTEAETSGKPSQSADIQDGVAKKVGCEAPNLQKGSHE